MKPPSGTWIGTILNVRNGRSAPLLLTLSVSDDGSFTGSATYNDGRSANTGQLEGRYSPYGTLHIRYAPDDQHVALFDGRFEVTDELHSIIYGTILLSTGENTQPGTVALLYAKEGTMLTNHVWGN